MTGVQIFSFVASLAGLGFIGYACYGASKGIRDTDGKFFIGLFLLILGTTIDLLCLWEGK